MLNKKQHQTATKVPRGLRIRLGSPGRPTRRYDYSFRLDIGCLPLVNKNAKETLLQAIDGKIFTVMGYYLLSNNNTVDLQSLAKVLKDKNKLSVLQQKVLSHIRDLQTPPKKSFRFTAPISGRNRNLMDFYPMYEKGFLFSLSLCSTIAKKPFGTPEQQRLLTILNSILSLQHISTKQFAKKDLDLFRDLPSEQIYYDLSQEIITINPNFSVEYDKSFWEKTKTRKYSDRHSPTVVKQIRELAQTAPTENTTHQNKYTPTNKANDNVGALVSNIGQNAFKPEKGLHDKPSNVETEQNEGFDPITGISIPKEQPFWMSD